ncbi:glutamine-dependent NAD(+) synthetase domain protein [Mycobacterium kansasii]|uniref:Glutamine-dependent NAD(+) synthetase domain protein n=1 Tax=Mycobacterium kansasii TaxID=1768 RepID=A0A1V3XLL9_MYCKA|nr:glutamine-dependent NAD(+) synthetase domain protein [Mycobacterium kansasii]
MGEVLQSVLDTEITPELVPSGEEEELQSSEAKVGPFALQDFSLFHVLRFGFRPSKIAFLAWHAWHDSELGTWPPGFPHDKRPSYSLSEIRHWLQVFVERFYSFSQFKRSALPNGPKVSHGERCPHAGIGAPVGHVGPDVARPDRAGSATRLNTTHPVIERVVA